MSYTHKLWLWGNEKYLGFTKDSFHKESDYRYLVKDGNVLNPIMHPLSEQQPFENRQLRGVYMADRRNFVTTSNGGLISWGLFQSEINFLYEKRMKRGGLNMPTLEQFTDDKMTEALPQEVD